MGSKATKPPAKQGGPARDPSGSPGTAGPGEGAHAADGGEETALQQRLRRLLESEREGQVRLRGAHEQHQAADQQNAAQRLAILQDALAEARAEVAKREEVEQTLGRVRIEAARLAIELNQAERDVEEARREGEEVRREVKPKTAERIARLDEALTETRSELARERERRERLERDFDAAANQAEGQLKQLRLDADQARAGEEKARADAEMARAETEKARAEAEKERAERNREQQRLEAIEQLLESATGPQGANSEAARDIPPRPAKAAVERAAEPARQPTNDDEPRAEPTQPGRRRRRKRVFETRGRTCAVCRRTEATSPGQLKASGWALGAEIDLCPDCQEKGWQLPRGGSLPFRRSSDRDKAG